MDNERVLYIMRRTSAEESCKESTTEGDTLPGTHGVEALVGKERYMYLLRNKINGCVGRPWVREFLYFLIRFLET
jgi:hypothetical protein